MTVKRRRNCYDRRRYREIENLRFHLQLVRTAETKESKARKIARFIAAADDYVTNFDLRDFKIDDSGTMAVHVILFHGNQKAHLHFAVSGKSTLEILDGIAFELFLYFVSPFRSNNGLGVATRSLERTQSELRLLKKGAFNG